VIMILQEVQRMSLGDLLNKYGKPDTKGWFSEKGTQEASCEGCIFDTGDPKYCLIYLEEAGKEKPQSCKHRKTFKEDVLG